MTSMEQYQALLDEYREQIERFKGKVEDYRTIVRELDFKHLWMG